MQIQRPRVHGYCLVHPIFPVVDGSATHLLPFMDSLGYKVYTIHLKLHNSFYIMQLNWILMFLFFFGSSPRMIFELCSYESINVKLEWDKKHSMEITGIETGLPSTMYYIFNTFLWCLQILHIYWWVLICRMFIIQIRSEDKIARDVRSGKIYIYIYISKSTSAL